MVSSALATLAILLPLLGAWRLRDGGAQRIVVLAFAVIVFQAMLGMWTVTLLLKPVVVTGHLLGGMTTFALLGYAAVRFGGVGAPDDALAGLERWKGRFPDAAKLLAVDDVLVDTMRGRFSTWTRIRINLRHVPEAERPAQETPDPNDAPQTGPGAVAEGKGRSRRKAEKPDEE